MRIDVLPDGHCAVVDITIYDEDTYETFLVKAREFSSWWDYEKIVLPCRSDKAEDKGRIMYRLWAIEHGIEMSSAFKKLAYQSYLRNKERKKKEEEEEKILAEKRRIFEEKRRKEQAVKEWERRKKIGCLNCPNAVVVLDDVVCKHSKDYLDLIWLDANLGLGWMKLVGKPNEHCKYYVEV